MSDEPCLICNRTDAWRDPICEKHPEIAVTYANLTRVVRREEWNATVPLANAVNAQLMDAYRESTRGRERLRDLSARFVWRMGVRP